MREEKKAGGEMGISPKKTIKQSGPPNQGLGRSEVPGYVKIGGNMILDGSGSKLSPQRNVIPLHFLEANLYVIFEINRPLKNKVIRSIEHLSRVQR